MFRRCLVRLVYRLLWAKMLNRSGSWALLHWSIGSGIIVGCAVSSYIFPQPTATVAGLIVPVVMIWMLIDLVSFSISVNESLSH